MAISENDVKGTIVLIIIFGLIVLAILYAIGMYFSNPCYSMGSCSQCWDANDETAKNNAYVNLTMCACGKAYKNNFNDNSLNGEIEERYKLLTNESAAGKARQICSGDLPLFMYE